jgi:hypothetical protein
LKAEREGREHPDRYRRIRYEALTEAPEATLRELCAFLGVAFDPQMLKLDASAENLGRARGATHVMPPKGSHALAARPPTLRRMEEIFLPAADAFGYEPLTTGVRPRPLGRMGNFGYSLLDGWNLVRFHVREFGVVKGLRYALSRRKLIG